MMYLFPSCKRVGKCPVYPEKTVFLSSYMLLYTLCTFRPRSVAVLSTSRRVRLGLVDLTFFFIDSDVPLVSRWFLGSIFHVAFIQHWPSYVVTFFDGLDPCGFDWISADCMHPLDGFFCVWKVVYTIGLLKIFLGFPCWIVWLPMPMSLGQ